MANQKMKEQGPATAEQRATIKQRLKEEVLDAFAHAVGSMSYSEASRILAARHGQIASYLEDALADAAQAIGNPDRFLAQEIKTLEVLEYNPAYTGAKPIDEQLEILNRDREKWGMRGEFSFTDAQKALLHSMEPNHLEGIFLMPPYTVIDDGNYLAAIEKLLKNFWNVSSLPFHLRDLEQTGAKLHRLKDEWVRQGSGNVTLAWGQLGALYAGKSALRADELMLAPEEGAMGVYGFLSLLITHPERMSQSNDPVAICSGDEIPVPGSRTRESKVPVISFFGNAPRFDTTRWDEFAVERMVPSLLIPHKVD